MSNNESVFQVGIVAVFAGCCYLSFWLGGLLGLAGLWRWIAAIAGGSMLTIAVVAVIFFVMFNVKK